LLFRVDKAISIYLIWRKDVWQRALMLEGRFAAIAAAHDLSSEGCSRPKADLRPKPLPGQEMKGNLWM
jgi:hypothetical protein